MWKCSIVFNSYDPLGIVISSSMGQSFGLSFNPLVDDPDQQKPPKEKYLDKFKEFWDSNLPLIAKNTKTTWYGQMVNNSSNDRGIAFKNTEFGNCGFVIVLSANKVPSVEKFVFVELKCCPLLLQRKFVVNDNVINITMSAEDIFLHVWESLEETGALQNYKSRCLPLSASLLTKLGKSIDSHTLGQLPTVEYDQELSSLMTLCSKVEAMDEH